MAVILLWAIAFFFAVRGQDVIIQTNYGPVQGFSNKTRGGKDAIIFLGIPFAKAPVDDLRFEKPQQLEPWTEILDATDYKSICYQYRKSDIPYVNDVSEDCLYLNIMAPKILQNQTYSVMVWIHGGAYELGDAIRYDYRSIVNNFVERDVVVVTVPYRLGVLGFMTTGDSVMPGNLGLWDQTAALKFIKENIVHFGGDPKRITIFGLSAGGGSVSALTLSPHSRDLFTSSIQLSGSTFAEWARSNEVKNNSLEVARLLDCPMDNSDKIKKCIKKKSIEEIWSAVERKVSILAPLRVVEFGPRIDGDFFPSNVETLVTEAPKKASIIGFAEKEGILFSLFPTGGSLAKTFISKDKFSVFNRASLEDFIRSRLAPSEVLKEQAKEVQDKIIDFYCNVSESSQNDYNLWLKKYTELLGDCLFTMPIMKEIDMKIANGWPVYLYISEYYNSALYSNDLPVKGATHSNEEMYLFDVFNVRKINFTNDDLLLKTVMLDSFTNFAKNGYPLLNDVVWEEATNRSRRNLRYLPSPKMSSEMLDNTYNFWMSMENYNYDIVTGNIKHVPVDNVTNGASCVLPLTFLLLLFLGSIILNGFKY